MFAGVGCIPARHVSPVPISDIKPELDDAKPKDRERAIATLNNSMEKNEGKEEASLAPKEFNISPDTTLADTKALDEALEYCRVAQDFWEKGDLENAIDALDQAYSLILKVEADDDSELIRQKEDIRFLISKRILEIYASRHTVANGYHNAIPLVINRYVKREIELLKGKDRPFLVEAYRRSGRYRPEIVKALKEAGLPEELSWLPLIESGFNVRAFSRARALGLWQFIPSTGYKFGLKRDRWVDERMDPVKSTRAAILYLKELHQIFGDWTTVLAAYNCGEGKVLKVIRNQNINYLDNFWDLYEKLPSETARYVPRFLACLFIIKEPEKYNVKLGRPDPSIPYEIVTVSKQARLKDIASTIGCKYEELKILNPELRYHVTPPESYPLKVPKGKASILVAKMDQIPAWIPPRRAYTYHIVRDGETLSHIALRYRTTVRRIATVNRIHRDRIRVGQKLKIPLRGTRELAYLERGKPGDTSSQLEFIHHRVKRGDSLWNLARYYGISIKQIKALNNLSNTQLHIGQVLIIPMKKGNGSSANRIGTYQVKAGDTPYQIARTHNMRLERLLQINRLTPRSKIYPGQILYVE